MEWTTIGIAVIVVIAAIVGILLVQRSRRRRPAASRGLPDLGALSGDSPDAKRPMPDPTAPKTSQQNPSRHDSGRG